MENYNYLMYPIIIFFVFLIIKIYFINKKAEHKYLPLKNRYLQNDKINIIFENNNRLMIIENMNKYKDVAISYNLGSIYIYIISLNYVITDKQKRITEYLVDTQRIFDLKIIYL